MKKVIRYRGLLRVLQKDFGFMDSIRFINRIRRFSPILIDALYEYQQNNTINNISVRDVSINELLENEKMSPIGAFVMLDWIEKKPEDAYNYMYKYRYSIPLPELTDAQKALVSERIKELRESSNLVKQDVESIIESDIDVPQK